MGSVEVVSIAAVATAVVYMTGAFLWARSRDRYDILQLVWGACCACIVVVAYFMAGHVPGFDLQTLLLLLISGWSARLFVHLYHKWAKLGSDDRRYQQLRRDYRVKKGGVAWNMYLKVYLIQGAWALIVTSPVLIAMAQPSVALSAWMLVGAAIWLCGFIFEAVGDHQLRLFREDPSNRGKILHTGLWRYSRHPNLFGESMQWWGVFFLVCTVPFGWAGILGPVVITWLLVFSGIPVRERQMKGREGWAEYVRDTSVFIPVISRK